MKDLGILGGGQLGRMTAIAAARLGLSTLIYDPDPHCCAAQVSPMLSGSFDDHDALSRFAAQVRRITLEFENVPSAVVRHLTTLKPMSPDADLLEICQDRLHEKNWLSAQGCTVAPFQAMGEARELISAIAQTANACFLKTRRFGYDGKGQIRLAHTASTTECHTAWEKLGGVPCILEESVDFTCEVSLIIARNASGQYTQLPLIENHHENLPGGGKILRTSIAPATVTPATQTTATGIGQRIAEASNLSGLLAIEMFLLEDGGLVVNELAPRPHNSGHWSIEAASLSQFDLLIRAVFDLPLPEKITVTPCIMHNLLGSEADDLADLLSIPNRFVHRYGKFPSKPGRKMGHLTQLHPQK